MNSKNYVSTVSPPRHGRFHQISGVLFCWGFLYSAKLDCFKCSPLKNLHNSDVANRDECDNLLIHKSVALKSPQNQHQIGIKSHDMAWMVSSGRFCGCHRGRGEVLAGAVVPDLISNTLSSQHLGSQICCLPCCRARRLDTRLLAGTYPSESVCP